MIEQQIIGESRTNCILSGDLGHPPGLRYDRAIRVEDPTLLRLTANGLHVSTGRQVFHSMEIINVGCPRCGAEQLWNRVEESVDEWDSGGSGIRTCGSCGAECALNDWQWDAPWGFGWLGFTFWNWAPLTGEFVAEVAELLGHRAVVPCGKI